MSPTTAIIGCVLLRDLFFVHEGMTLDGPEDFAKNIVKYKGYDLATTGRHVDLMFETMLGRADVRFGGDEVSAGSSVVPGPVFGKDRLVRARVGQQAFQGLVLTSYERRCAITGNHIRPTLQAAHIRPVSLDGQNRVDNGLLLRSDVHTLFDLGYLGINERYELQVSRRSRKTGATVRSSTIGQVRRSECHGSVRTDPTFGRSSGTWTRCFSGES